MSVETNVSQVIYTAPGGTAQFTVTFRFLENEHLVVSTKAQGAQNYTTRTLGVDYNVSGAGDAAGTGKVTFVSNVAQNTSVKIVRAVPITQMTAFRSQGDFLPGTHEDALDKLTMIAQQLNDGTILANNITGGGEVNTGSNVGGGQGVFKSKSGVTLQFRTLFAGDDGISVTTIGDAIYIGSTYGVFPWRGSFTKGGGTWTSADSDVTGYWLASIDGQVTGRCRLNFTASPGTAASYVAIVTPQRDADKAVLAAVTKNANYLDVYLYLETNNGFALTDDVSFEVVILKKTQE